MRLHCASSPASSEQQQFKRKPSPGCKGVAATSPMTHIQAKQCIQAVTAGSRSDNIRVRRCTVSTAKHFTFASNSASNGRSTLLEACGLDLWALSHNHYRCRCSRLDPSANSARYNSGCVLNMTACRSCPMLSAVSNMVLTKSAGHSLSETAENMGQ